MTGNEPSLVACGFHAVEAVLADDAAVVSVLLLDRERRDRRVARLRQLAERRAVIVELAPRPVLDEVADGVRHQGVVLRYRPGPGRLAAAGWRDSIAAHPTDALCLVLDGVQDPHNLGACLRSAAAAGVHCVVVPRDGSCSLTAAARRAAAGGAESVPLERVANLSRTLREMRRAGLWLVGLDEDAGTALYDVDLSGPLALVLGGEGRGLRRLTRERCDVVASIPAPGSPASLNVSVAAGVSLFEALRQRHSVPLPSS